MKFETTELFREDAYLKTCEAKVIAVTSADTVDADAGKTHSIILNQTVFYPEGGGQPGDSGILRRADGGELRIHDTQKHDGAISHLTTAAETPEVGENVRVEIDWERRHRHMRMHSCMHMLCAAIPAPVTGGSIHADSARLDFNLPNPPSKQELEATLNRLIKADHPMKLSWITDAELAAQPDLVRTMSVQPPRGAGRVRLVEFEGADLQPCGGTHVASTGEIGVVRVRSIKSKGKQNRRVVVEFG